VTFFYQNSRFIRGTGSSESTRFPEGLVLGNWAKTLHPRNVGSTKFVDKLVGLLREDCSVSREGNIHEEILMKIMHHANLLIMCESNS
jgi:hypothetical protein